ncbi:MAG: hypothetical protein Kow0013_30150 [Pararhodobacter sp.]
MRILSTAAFLTLLPTLALADGFYTRDLGGAGSPQDCLARGRAAIQAYANQSGTPNATINEGSWSVHGFDLQPGNVDVQIACPYRNNVVEVALLVAHSRDDREDRVAVVDGISAHWDAYVAGGGGVPSK